MRKCLTTVAAVAVLAGGLRAEPAQRVTSIVRGDARTGRLVRSVVIQPRVVSPKAVQKQSAAGSDATARNREPVDPLPSGADVREMIDHAAHKYKVDPNLVHAVVKVESNYNPFAVSHAGAEGLMQLVPSTARRFGVTNSFDARQNIEAGVRYLKYLQTLYGNNTRLALAAYNAGEGAVMKYRGIPRYRETENYLVLVGKRWGELNRARKAEPARKPEPAGQVTAGSPAAGHRPVERVVDAEGRIHFRTK